MELDLLVIGSGPGGQRAAIQAAKLGKRVAVAERRNRLGGVSIHTGRSRPRPCARRCWSSSPRARSTSWIRHGSRRPSARRSSSCSTAPAPWWRPRPRSPASSSAATTSGCCPATRVFEDDHTVRIDGSDEPIRAARIVIAVGTRPARPASVEFDDRTIIDSDGLLKLETRVPRTMVVVGGGRDRRRVRVDVRRARDQGHRRRPARPRALVPRRRDRRGVPVPAAPPQRDVPAAREGRRRRGAEGPRRAAEAGTRARRSCPRPCSTRPAGRATPSSSGWQTTGLETDKRGRIKVDENYRTAVPHIFAVGDCAGGAGLAATAMEQGRIAALHAFDQPVSQLPELIPTGVYAIPELAHGRPRPRRS